MILLLMKVDLFFQRKPFQGLFLTYPPLDTHGPNQNQYLLLEARLIVH